MRTRLITLALTLMSSSLMAATKPTEDNTEPPEVGVISQKGELEFLWTDNQIPANKPSRKMEIIIISESAGKKLELPAFIPNDSLRRSKSNDVTCTYDMGVGSCVTCQDDGQIDTKALAKIPGISVVTANSHDYQAKATGLEAGKYFIFTQFAPDGAEQSSCEQAFVY